MTSNLDPAALEAAYALGSKLDIDWKVTYMGAARHKIDQIITAYLDTLHAGEGEPVAYLHHDHLDRLLAGGQSEQATLFRKPPFPELARHFPALYATPRPVDKE